MLSRFSEFSTVIPIDELQGTGDSAIWSTVKLINKLVINYLRYGKIGTFFLGLVAVIYVYLVAELVFFCKLPK